MLSAGILGAVGMGSVPISICHSTAVGVTGATQWLPPDTQPLGDLLQVTPSGTCAAGPSKWPAF